MNEYKWVIAFKDYRGTQVDLITYQATVPVDIIGRFYKVFTPDGTEVVLIMENINYIKISKKAP